MNDSYNAHTHVFTGKCAPKTFLEEGLNIGDSLARLLQNAFMSGVGSWIVRKLGDVISNRKLQFLKIGVMANQQLVLENNYNNYINSSYSNIKMIGLTMDMDYMVDPENKPTQDFNSQIQEIVELKKTYPDRFFPFYGVDPRNPDTLNLTYLEKYISTKTFSGIKIYPALGFFPFDARLDVIYDFAVKNNIPVMTHCTRAGVYYLGKNVLSLIPDTPSSLNPSHPAMQQILNRIAAYKNSNDSSITANSRICNLFSHPENYLPVLDKYKSLRLCLAHLGGSSEILGNVDVNPDRKSFNKLFQLENAAKSWYEIIKDKLLVDFPNVYSDISYSLSDRPSLNVIVKDIAAGKLDSNKILFGTDYFLVEQEDVEMKVVGNALDILQSYIPQMISDNVKNYLF